MPTSASGPSRQASPPERRSLRRRGRRRRGERGVALVEFALVAPILFLLLFGTIELGWAFVQYLDVRHGAREGARLAAVNFRPTTATGDAQRAEILAATCARMDSSTSVRVRFTQLDGPDTNATPGDIGDLVVVEVESDLDTLTGLLDAVLGGITLNSTVTLRAEQSADWASSDALESCA